MSSALKKTGPVRPKKLNAVRRIMEREERVRSNSAAASPISTANQSSRPQCPNKANCPGSDVHDGVCHGCGVVVDDSNIVAEVQFGEASNGAAILQGSYFGADQGGVRPAAGGAFRRVPGGGASQSRERTFREVKQLISQFARQLRLPESLAESGFRNYKMASLDYNFVQGRQKHTVAAMCLYAACRREDNCKVMLIDLADLVRYDVFSLGNDYKKFLELYPAIKEGTKPIIMEDLIFRFASRLEFGRDTNKVAIAAVRIAKRMQYDEMTHGRKPAGICGAALIMAARAHNYRRTVREVVYIAKVTMHTLLTRMEEFSNVPSAQMSVEEFTTQDFLEAHHDPPLVYKRTKEWQDKHPKRKNKRKLAAIMAEAHEAAEAAEQQSREKRRKTTEQETAAQPGASSEAGPSDRPLSPSATPEPESASQSTNVPSALVDKDGFVIPPRPQQQLSLNQNDRADIQIATAVGDDELSILADRFDDDDADLDPGSETAMAIAQGIEVPSRGRKKKTDGRTKGKSVSHVQELFVDEEWEADEAALESEMRGYIDRKESASHVKAGMKDVEKQRMLEKKEKLEMKAREAAAAKKNGRVNLMSAGKAGASDDTTADAALGAQAEAETPAEAENTTAEADDQPSQDPSHPFPTPPSKVSSSTTIHEDEFKDDPEVMYCMLSEEEVSIKECIWVNHNKEHMREQQSKLFLRKMEGDKPKKPRSHRKNNGDGDGPNTPASTPGEAAANAVKKRNVSMRINYDFDSEMFMSNMRGPGSLNGVSSVGSRSAVTSRRGSVDGTERGRLRSPTPEAEDETMGLDDEDYDDDDDDGLNFDDDALLCI